MVGAAIEGTFLMNNVVPRRGPEPARGRIQMCDGGAMRCLVVLEKRKLSPAAAPETKPVSTPPWHWQ